MSSLIRHVATPGVLKNQTTTRSSSHSALLGAPFVRQARGLRVKLGGAGQIRAPFLEDEVMVATRL